MTMQRGMNYLAQLSSRMSGHMKILGETSFYVVTVLVAIWLLIWPQNSDAEVLYVLVVYMIYQSFSTHIRADMVISLIAQ